MDPGIGLRLFNDPVGLGAIGVHDFLCRSRIGHGRSIAGGAVSHINLNCYDV
jgi:hypothetical protein